MENEQNEQKKVLHWVRGNTPLFTRRSARTLSIPSSAASLETLAASAGSFSIHLHSLAISFQVLSKVYKDTSNISILEIK